MGLQIVELMMSVEDAFGMEFTDANAAKLSTVGAMHDAILQTLRERGESPDRKQTWHRLREIIVAQLGVRPEEVTPAASFVRDLGC